MTRLHALLLFLLLGSCSVMREPQTTVMHTYKVTVNARPAGFEPFQIMPCCHYSMMLYSDAQLDAFKQEMRDEGLMNRTLLIEQIN
jgi:hypothetical protein